MSDGAATGPQGLVEEAVVQLTSQPGDVRAVGAAVTAALCGHWEHEGPCRWPHHSSSEGIGAGLFRVTTVVLAGAQDAGLVRRAIREAVRAGGLAGEPSATWTVMSQRSRAMTAEEQALARRLRGSRPS